MAADLWRPEETLAPGEGEAGSAWADCTRAGDLAGLKKAFSSCGSNSARTACIRQPVGPRGAGSVGNTALHWLAAAGSEDGVQWLLTLPADTLDCSARSLTGVTNNGGSTPLHTACSHGHAAVVAILMAHGGHEFASAADSDGDTPLTAAARRGHEAAALRLLTAPSMASVSRRPPAHVSLTVSIAGKLAGELLFELYEADAPRACANFLGLAQAARGSGYRGTHFHRLLAGQVVQGGKLPHGQLSIFGGYFKDEVRASLLAFSPPGDRCAFLLIPSDPF